MCQKLSNWPNCSVLWLYRPPAKTPAGNQNLPHKLPHNLPHNLHQIFHRPSMSVPLLFGTKTDQLTGSLALKTL